MARRTARREKIRIEGVGLTYRAGGRSVKVLEKINLSIGEGEFVTIIGPSGCGKSTLLNVISHTVNQASAVVAGRIHIDWRSDRNHRLGYVLQKDTLLPWRTLHDNVEVGLEIMGMDRTERNALTQQWIDRVGLTGFERSYPHTLSGGMRQRANIIRTLACDPEVVLMDEPFGALDAQTRIVLQQLLIDLWHATRTTILFVTHDLEESVLLGERVVLLSPRPATVQRIYQVDIPQPRSVLEAKITPEFQEVYRNIWQDLKENIPFLLNKKEGPP